MSKIKLSIIVPCYKVEAYLPKCLDSLINQTLKEIEIICINDGSPDNCLKILKQYHKKYPNKIVIIDKQNEGLFKAREDGIKIAKGEYIGCVDSDDYVSLEYASKLYNAAKKENADICVCGFDRIDLETNKLYSREMTKFKYKSIIVEENQGALLPINSAVWNKIYKSSLLKELIKLKKPPIVIEDVMFQLLVDKNAHKIIFINDSLIYYMVRKDSIINTLNQDLIPSIYDTIKEIRDIYVKEKPEYLEYVDANAFLHLGISLMYRVSADKNINFKQVLKENTAFLDENFPKWRNNKYIKLSYIITHKGLNFKLWVVRQFYRFHIFNLFLTIYKFMINKLKIDIKW